MSPAITVFQPTVPHYRVGLFDRLSAALGPRFAVYASKQDATEGTAEGGDGAWHRQLDPMRKLLPGVYWQVGALSVPIARGDIVVVCGAPRYLSTIAILLKAKLKGAKTIWWGHYWSATSKTWRAALRMGLMQLADAVMFYTDREVEEYSVGRHTRHPVASALNNGIETTEIVRLRRAYDACRRDRDLLFIGRLTQKANLLLLLEALAHPDSAGVTLDVVGDGEAKAKLISRCAELGLAGRVNWHGSVLDEERIADVANRCKAFVYPGSVGLSLIHGLAYGLPAIVHDDRWRHMPEIAALQRGRNGVTFHCGDAGSLAQAIAETLQDTDRLGTMSRAAIETIARSFNAADMTDRFLRAINALEVQDSSAIHAWASR